MTPREQLAKYLETPPCPPRGRVAGAVGISLSALSQYLNEKYPGDVAAIDEKVRRFFREQSDKTLSAQAAPVKTFAPTRQAKLATSVLRECHLYGEMGLIIGAPGVGKTEAIKQYCAENKGAIKVTTRITVNIRVLLVTLSEMLRIGSNGVNDYLARSVINVLKGTGRILIVDEAQHLTDKCLEILRQIHDETEIGLVYAGSKDLYLKIARLEQIASRIGSSVELPPLEHEDARLIMASTGVPVAEATVIKAAEFAEGSARRLSKGLQKARRLSDGAEITPGMIVAAQKYIMGR